MRRLIVVLWLWPVVSVANDEALEPIWIESVTATSTYASPKNAYDPVLTLAPRTTWIAKTDDHRYDSAWCEGKPDEGIGEGITIHLAKPTTIENIAIKPGVWMTPKLFAANHQITGLEITTDDGRKLTASPAAKREEVEVKLGGAPVSRLVVKVTSVKKGKMNDSCITQIRLNDEEQALAVGFDKAAATAFAATVKPAVAAMWDGTCDAAKLAKYYDTPFKFTLVENTHASQERHRFKKHPKTLKTVAALAKWCSQMGTTSESFALQTGARGTVIVGAETADTVQQVHFGWRKGQWRVTKID